MPVDESSNVITKPLYLIASAGLPNHGDEVITAAWLRTLAKHRPKQEVWLDSPNPGSVMHIYGKLHPRLRVTNTVWRFMHDLSPLPEDEAVALISERVRNLGTPLYDGGMLTIREAASLHVLGGGFVNKHWQAQERILSIMLAYQKLTGVKLYATGMGLMPTDRPDWLREVADKFDHFSVRDQPSAKIVGRPVTGDDSFLGLGEVRGFLERSPHPSANQVWVNLQSDVGSPEEISAAVAAVRHALTKTDLADRPAYFIEGIPGADGRAYEQLKDLIPAENFVGFYKLWGTGFPARKGQVWLTSRFHMHLMAASCGAKGSAISVKDDYYGVKHQSAIDAGTGWSLTPAGATELAEPTGNSGFVVQAGSLREAKLREAKELYPPVVEAPKPRQPQRPRSKLADWLS